MNARRDWMLSTLEDIDRVAQSLSHILVKGDVLCLKGGLGVGKTTLARALIRALTGSPTEVVPSPSFTLVQVYDTSAGAVWHFDLFRLKRWEEVLELGWEEAIEQGIVLIEWPEIIGRRLPSDRLEIELRFFNALETYPQGRWLSMEGFGSWRRVKDLMLET